MSDQSAPAHAGPDAHGDAHAGHDAHGDAHAGHAGHDDHSGHHDGPSLGPIDWRMWGVGVLGVLSALVVVAGFVAATGFAFNA
jgi:hypothetical protein